MTYDDHDPWNDDDEDALDGNPDECRWRPHSRAGMASLAMGVVAAFVLGLTAPMAGRGNGVLGIIVLAAAPTAAMLGLVLGVGGLCQRDVRRGYALLGTVVNLALLVIALALASADGDKPKPSPRRGERSSTTWQQRQV